MTTLYDPTREELAESLQGEPRYRLDQLWAGLYTQLAAPVEINIVCFRHRAPGLNAAAQKALNVEIMLRLQEEGTAAVSDTTVHGEHCLRAAINNHRTRPEDLDLLLDEVLRHGMALQGC